MSASNKIYDLEDRTLGFSKRIIPLLQETTELVKIFAAILEKSKIPNKL